MTLAKPCGMKLRSRLCLRTSSSNACTPGLHQGQQIGRVRQEEAGTWRTSPTVITTNSLLS